MPTTATSVCSSTDVVVLDWASAFAAMLALERRREHWAQTVGKYGPRSTYLRALEESDRALAAFERAGLSVEYRGPVIPRHRALVRVEVPRAA